MPRGRPKKIPEGGPIEIDPNLAVKPMPKSLSEVAVKPYVRLCDYWELITDTELNEAQKASVKLLEKYYGEPEVMVGMDIVLDRYWFGDRETAFFAFGQLARVCLNKRVVVANAK